MVVGVSDILLGLGHNPIVWAFGWLSRSLVASFVCVCLGGACVCPGGVGARKAHKHLAHKQFLGDPCHQSSRPGTWSKMFMFLGFRTQHINI